MPTKHHVRLFKNGRNQALRIPREFELPSDEAIVSKEGNWLIIKPVKNPSLLDVLAALQPIDEGFPDVDKGLPPLDDIRL